MVVFDYVGRTKRVQDKAKAEGVACCIIMRPANIRYLTGYWGYATRAEYFEPRRLIALIVPANAKPLLITPKIENSFAREATKGVPVEHRRHVEWKEDGETADSWGLARNYLKEVGVTSGRVAFEMQHLTMRATHALKEAFGGFQLADCAGWVDEMRAVKDATEIALMRRCGTLAVEMFELQTKALGEKQWREYELALHGLEYVAHKCAAELEGTDVNSPLGDGVQLITSGPRNARAHGSASVRRIEPHDTVMFDFCRVPYVLGYRNGRGVGIEAVEAPEIKEGGPDRLKEGMIISIEPSIYREGYAARIENTPLITRDGAELLTPAGPGTRVMAK